MPENEHIRRLLELRNKVVQLLVDEGCTVREAAYILTQASRAINATAAVQPITSVDYEF